MNKTSTSRLNIQTYDRVAAVEYAHKWAYGRNPAYYDFSKIGGDCTSFASQCIYAGAGVMNYTPTFGWFYISSSQRAPSWTGVEYLYNFLTGNAGVGPFGQEVSISDIMPGDIIQLSTNQPNFHHSPVVVTVGDSPRPCNIFLAAHSFDADNRPLFSYDYTKIRFIHIEGVRTL